MTMLLGEFAALFAGTALPEGPLLAPTWVRFFVRRRAIVVYSCGVMWFGGFEGRIFLEGNFRRSQSGAWIR
jgi:hypothetical protein